MRNMKFMAWLMILAVLTACLAGALGEGQEILLPDGVHRMTVPKEMVWQEPSSEESDLKGILLMPPELEMLVFAYESPAENVQVLAEALTNAGRPAEVREIAGMEFLVFQDRDDADGASCAGYSYLSGNLMTEISFFYSSQAAMDLTQTIMESFQ